MSTDPGSRRRPVRNAFPHLTLWGIALLPAVALAQSADMPGQQLLLFARNYIIAPIALFAMVLSGVAAFVRPEMIKVTGYVAFVAVLLYFLTANADRILQVLRAG